MKAPEIKATTPVNISLLLVTAISVGACDDAKEAASGATPSATAEAKTQGEPAKTAPAAKLELSWAGFEIDSGEIDAADGVAEIDGDSITILVPSKSLGTLPCFHEMKSGRDLEPGQYVLEIFTKSMDKQVPFTGKPGTIEGVGMRPYWHDGTGGTNTGKGPNPERASTLVIDSIADGYVVGSFSDEDAADERKLRAQFRAKICDPDTD